MCRPVLAICLVIYSITSIEAQFSIRMNREEVALQVENVKALGRIHLQTINTVPQIIRNYKNVYYYGYVRIGTPGDLVRVMFDTGSPSLWVYSGSGWKSWLCVPCWFHKSYQHSMSSTYVPNGRPIEINYVNGYMKGFVSQDILSIGPLTSTVSFAEATSSTPLLNSVFTKYDGIMGLSPCSGSLCSVYKESTPSVINPILSQLSEPIFSVYLNRDIHGQSEIIFGGTNPTLYKEETLTMHHASSPYLWSVRIESVWVGDIIVLNYTNGVDAFIDTGTSLIVGPPADVAQLFCTMKLYPQLQVGCDRVNILPNVTFVIGGKKYTLNWNQYITTKVDVFGYKKCSLGLQAIDIGTRGWILGDLFLSNFYTIFEVGDHSASRIGFADLK